MGFRTAGSRRAPKSGARLRRAAVIFASMIAVGGMSAATASLASASSAKTTAPAKTASASATANVKHACGSSTAGKTMACDALINTKVAHESEAQLKTEQKTNPKADPTGITPSDLQAAYNLASAASSGGSGQTVVLVDAYDYTTAQSDLDTYRSQFGLPACDSGCFTKYNQDGSTSSLPPSAGSTGWDVEEALDIDMVSAICPNCHIDLVEANSDNNSDLYTAENTAAKLGKFVSNSWGGSEYSGETSDADSYFNHPGVAITVSAGDTPGPEFPAEAPDVTAVGGTTLTADSSSSRGWTESDWSDSGGGCSADEPAPSWQSSSVTGCSNREDNDISADADPNSGAAIYNTESEGGWLQVGGTSESSPIIAATFALAGTPASSGYPVQNIWTNEPNGLYAVVSGGYDSVSGWGTPNGVSALLASITKAGKRG